MTLPDPSALSLIITALKLLAALCITCALLLGSWMIWCLRQIARQDAQDWQAAHDALEPIDLPECEIETATATATATAIPPDTTVELSGEVFTVSEVERIHDLLVKWLALPAEVR